MNDIVVLIISFVLCGSGIAFVCSWHYRKVRQDGRGYHQGYQDGYADGLTAGLNEYHRCGPIRAELFDDCGLLDVSELKPKDFPNAIEALDNCLQQVKSRFETADKPTANTGEQASSS